LVKEELKRLQWAATDLAQRRRGDLHKLEMARRLRQETMMTLHWIAQRLRMGAAGSLANLLRNAKVKYAIMRDRPVYTDCGLQWGC
jgi:hypothetical protein